MKEFTYKDIKSWGPCYDPIRHIPENWKGNALDVLLMKDISIKDKFWCVFRKNLISDKVLRLLAVWCYRETLKFIKDPDPRSIKAADVAEAYGLGKANDKELLAAKESARSAAWSASASSAANAVAANAVADAAVAAAEAADATAPVDATWYAVATAWSATWYDQTARSAQLEKLIDLIKQEKNNE